MTDEPPMWNNDGTLNEAWCEYEARAQKMSSDISARRQEGLDREARLSYAREKRRARNINRPKQKRGPKHKLTPEQVERIRGSYLNKFRTQIEIAEYYGVSQATISNICRDLSGLT